MRADVFLSILGEIWRSLHVIHHSQFLQLE